MLQFLEIEMCYLKHAVIVLGFGLGWILELCVELFPKLNVKLSCETQQRLRTLNANLTYKLTHTSALHYHSRCTHL